MRRRILRDLPGVQDQYDRFARGPLHIVESLKRYDRAVVVRLAVRPVGEDPTPVPRWEIWRFKGLVIPRDPARVSPEEWCRRAVYCFTCEAHLSTCGLRIPSDDRLRGDRRVCTCGGLYVPLDDRARRALWWGDLFRRLGVDSTGMRRGVGDQLDAQDADREALIRPQIETVSRAMGADYAAHLKSTMFHMGRGR